MSYKSDALPGAEQNDFKHLPKEQLEEHVSVLMEWKRKATLQLEYFRYACVLYKLCDVEKVNELLNV